MATTHCGASSQTWRSPTPTTAPAHTMASTSTSAHPLSASPATALLANRDDLTSAYVHAVVRMGKGAMPPQTRVDITNAELDSVAAYLARGK